MGGNPEMKPVIDIDDLDIDIDAADFAKALAPALGPTRFCNHCGELAPAHLAWCVDARPEDKQEAYAPPSIGARKDDSGKAPIAQGVFEYFPRALEAVATVSQFGFEKYGEWGGWRRVPDGFNRYKDALGRHLLDAGKEAYAHDSKLLHRAHLAWNALATLELLLQDGNVSVKEEVK